MSFHPRHSVRNSPYHLYTGKSQPNLQHIYIMKKKRHLCYVCRIDSVVNGNSMERGSMAMVYICDEYMTLSLTRFSITRYEYHKFATVHTHHYGRYNVGYEGRKQGGNDKKLMMRCNCANGSRWGPCVPGPAIAWPCGWIMTCGVLFFMSCNTLPYYNRIKHTAIHLWCVTALFIIMWNIDNV